MKCPINSRIYKNYPCIHLYKLTKYINCKNNTDNDCKNNIDNNKNNIIANKLIEKTFIEYDVYEMSSLNKFIPIFWIIKSSNDDEPIYIFYEKEDIFAKMNELFDC